MSGGSGGQRSPRRRSAGLRPGPLANADFRLLSSGQLTSTIGDFCYAVALPWLILSTHGGPVLLGTVLACYGVPRTVLIPVGGILADKVGPRTVMLAADIARCVLVTALAVLAARRTDSLAMLGPIAALLGAGEGVFLPASYTIMPAILESDQLQAGNALSTAMVQTGSLAGPVLGGLLASTAGPVPAFTVDAASFATSAAALALISTRRRPAPTADPGEPGERSMAEERAAGSAPGVADPAGTVPAGPDPAGPDPAGPDPAGADPAGTEPAVAAAAAGPVPAAQTARAAEQAAPSVWALLRRSRLLQTIVAVCVAANLASGGTFEVALPALAHERFGAAGYGALIACFGAGAVIGTLAASRASGLRRQVFIACGAFLIEGAAICLVPFLGGLAGACAAILLVAICNGFGNIVVITLIQQWAPGHLLGRVMSLVMLASMGSFPASVAVSGVLVRHLGPAPFFPVAGIVLAVSVLGALSQREFRDFGVTAADVQGGLRAEPA